jgi:hypothetical protein
MISFYSDRKGFGGTMDLSELLQQFGGGLSTQAPDGIDVEREFEQVSGQLPKDALAGGIAEAFRSDQTPPFANMLGGLFGNSGGSQQASVLNILLSVVGPVLMQRMMGGGAGAAGGSSDALGGILGSVLGGGQGQMSRGGGGIEDLLGSVLGGGGGSGSAGGGLQAVLGQILGGGGGGMRELSEMDASQFSPDEVQALAEEAQRQDPSVVDRLSELFAENPGIVRSMGSDALSLALSKIAQSQRSF